MKAPRLKAWREAAGETQATLAERAGVTEHTILRVEHGAEMRPTTARKLADALGLEVADLMENPPALSSAGKAEAPPSGQAETADERLKRRRAFLDHIRTLDREELVGLSDEIDEAWAKASTPSESEEAIARGLMVRMQIRVVDNPHAIFEPVQAQERALVGV